MCEHFTYFLSSSSIQKKMLLILAHSESPIKVVEVEFSQGDGYEILINISEGPL